MKFHRIRWSHCAYWQIKRYRWVFTWTEYFFIVHSQLIAVLKSCKWKLDFPLIIFLGIMILDSSKLVTKLRSIQAEISLICLVSRWSMRWKFPLTSEEWKSFKFQWNGLNMKKDHLHNLNKLKFIFVINHYTCTHIQPLASK